MPKLRWKYVFLTASLISLAIAVLDHEPSRISYLSLPVGTILFGLFLIWNVLEKESALFDEQNQKAPLAQKPAPSKRPREFDPADAIRPVLPGRLS